jgi:hypothetical protein
VIAQDIGGSRYGEEIARGYGVYDPSERICLNRNATPLLTAEIWKMSGPIASPDSNVQLPFQQQVNQKARFLL